MSYHRGRYLNCTAVAGAGAHNPDAGAIRGHVRDGHLEAEHAVLDGGPRGLDAHLPAQLVHDWRLPRGHRGLTVALVEVVRCGGVDFHRHGGELGYPFGATTRTTNN